MASAHQSNLPLRYVPTPEEPEVLVLGSGSGMVGISRIRCVNGGVGHFSPAPEDAFLVSHHLSNFHSDVWVDGKLVQKPANIAGLTSIHDYRRKIDCHMHTAFDTLTFHLPWAALESACPDSQGGRLEDLSVASSSPMNDPTVRALASTILPTLDYPERISLLYLDHVCSALATHIVTAYGRVREAKAGGTLAPWQERRVKEMIAANLDGEIRLADLAAECRLSVGHFVRAFRRTANTTPYQWLLQRRIDHAKTLMRDGSQTLADVALACGFADQSHFTRTFSRLVGSSPHSWRRCNAAADAVLPPGRAPSAPAGIPYA
ncbi:helix-turn-helix transcriptional regulator [Azospirillum sp. YIM B02556]|uniref:Helix-turn-helix transcriptional regulator n=1 Tax=Azospirillum endophyticum TaxID=2800326 RepID=A0ABS1FGX7_9PROT|nr:AraC family transcriptional regulator [Azospirillum endophyticum]MBK1842686.1 helix-turn-helix transcriptional regulator [Azospirillum endophyticum]